jgi:arsenite methyltransferase
LQRGLKRHNGKSGSGENGVLEDVVTRSYLDFRINLDDPRTVAAYDELPLWSAMFGLLLLRHVPLGEKLSVLDVGFGTGFPMLELAERLGALSRVWGIDPWRAAGQRAKQKAARWGVRNVAFRAGDAAAMPFADARFDLVVSNLGINNFTNPEQVLRECRRVLKPSGTLVLTTNLQGHMKEFYSVYEATLRELGLGGAVAALRRHIRHRATVAGLEALFERTGFRVHAVHRETQIMRFASGSALFNHHFVKLGFLDGWKAVVEPHARKKVFSALERNLNRLARAKGDLSLSIPMAYVEARKDSTANPRRRN